VAEWKATLSIFAEQLKREELPSVTAKPSKTHGSKLVLRWVLHVSGPFHSEMRRLEDLAQHIDMSEHPTQRRAVMGLIMVQAMARGDKFMYVNEVELVWGSKRTKIQSRHLDGGEEGLMASLIVLNRDSKLSTWHTKVSGFRHNDPRFMSVPEHGWRVHLMRRQYQADPDHLKSAEGGLVRTPLPTTSSEVKGHAYFQYLNSNDWHAGPGGDGQDDRIVLFMAFTPWPNDRAAWDTAKTTSSHLSSTPTPSWTGCTPAPMLLTATPLVTGTSSSTPLRTPTPRIENCPLAST
jgi:hypothetical protein